jgi:hypothetical protein
MPCSLTRFGSTVLIVIALGTSANAAEFSLPCGLNPKDWCASRPVILAAGTKTSANVELTRHAKV